MADADTYVYVHANNVLLPRETTNGRSATATWANISIPGGTPVNGWGMFTYYCGQCRLIESDKTNGDIYLYNVNRGGSFGTGDAIYKRTKSTGLWSLQLSNPGIVQANIIGQMKHVPGNAGHLFFSSGQAAAGAFSFTNNGWTNLYPVNALITQCRTYGLGAIYAGQSYPSIFMLGTYNGVEGYYLCKDFNPLTRAGTWVKQTYSGQPPLTPTDIGGDPGIPGRFIAYCTAGAFWTILP
jgi:hypothetical protein